MSLLDALKNFDPAKDKVSASNNGLPAGEYDVAIDSIGHHVYEKSGWECFQVVLSVLTGDHAGEKEYINISLATKTKDGKEMPSFVVDTAVKSIGALAYCIGIDMSLLDEPLSLDNETDIYEALDKLFKEKGQGVQLKLIVKVTPNKKNPDNPYKNYEYEKTEQAEPIDVDDNDLPF